MAITLTARRSAKNKKPTLTQKVKKGYDKAHKYTATRLAWAVVALQGALLLTLTVTEPADPPKGTVLELFWASTQRAVFYPLVALLIGGPVLTIMAWQAKGRHRSLLMIAWPLFFAVLLYFFEARFRVMLKALAIQYL